MKELSADPAEFETFHRVNQPRLDFLLMKIDAVISRQDMPSDIGSREAVNWLTVIGLLMRRMSCRVFDLLTLDDVDEMTVHTK